VGGKMDKKEQSVIAAFCILLTIFTGVCTVLLILTDNLFWIFLNTLMCLKAVVGFSRYEGYVTDSKSHSIYQMVSLVFIRFY